MDIENKVKNWNYNQFLTFLLLYCASSDYNISKAEKEYIKSITDNTNIKIIRDIFDNLSDYEIVQTVMSFKEKYFNTSESKEKIYKDMSALFLSDEKYTLNEENLFGALKGLLNSI